jgi:lysophospholipase L1-like esterase
MADERISLNSPGPGHGRRRQWPFRVAAIVLGLSLFVLVESVLVLFDIGRGADYDDPFVGFHDIHPLFIPDAGGERFEIPKARQRFFAPESFPVRKESNTFRVFCLGGSTVQGRPFSTLTSFTTWLSLSLAEADPKRNWEVVNCGGISYASYRLVPIFKECLGYEPDLFIICTGHNEFLEERTYGPIKHAPPLLKAAQRTVASLRTYTLLRESLLSATSGESRSAETAKTEMSVDADALLDYQRGIEAYHRDEEFLAGVVVHFEHNVRRMIAIAGRADIPLILIRPPSNLADCPPFKSEHRERLAEDELRRWDSLIERAKAHYRDDLAKSIELLHKALDIDDRYAAIYYELGKCYQLIGQHRLARDAFVRARELDICPLRMIAPLEQALARAADDTRTPLIDAHALLVAESPFGILGGELLVDHIHPNFRGHQLIANALTQTMIDRQWVKPAGDWHERRNRAYQQHFDSIETVYFARGKRELDALREWAAGRADGPPIEFR